MFGKDKYIWKKIPRRYSWSGCIFDGETLDDLDFYNFPAWFRAKRNWKSYLKNYFTCKELEKEYQVNFKLRKQKFIETDSWVYETKASAWTERKSWKRNSKRKHQFKGV